ncbi:thrombospondin [Plantactinospora sp. WMMB334]|uniref:thrombospondin n=1 Tax=Plantactinospora sp. WMMB334 TaxID=3404119 RepID=UPI003B95A160
MRHSEPAPARDTNRDGRVDARDDNPGAGDENRDVRDTNRDGRVDARDDAATGTVAPVADTDRADSTTTQTTPQARTTVPDRDTGTTATVPETETRPARPDAATTTDTRATDDRSADPERGLGERTPESTERVVVDRGPRPRASMLATLSLVFGVAAAAFVLAGALAGYGIALGVIALLLGVSGVSATARRHVAGKTDALIGIVLGVGAVVVAVLAMTGQFEWPTTDGDVVVRFREWLDSQFVDRF